MMKKPTTFGSSSSFSHHTRPLTNFSIESIMGFVRNDDKDRNNDNNNNNNNSSSKRYNDEIRDEDLKEVKNYRPKNFQCPDCKMAFSNNGQLKTHVRIHTGERPFKCNHSDCNKTFTRNEELTRHKLIHTGVRPHACSSCGKRFGRKDHLKKHTRTHEKHQQRLFSQFIMNEFY